MRRVSLTIHANTTIIPELVGISSLGSKNSNTICFTLLDGKIGWIPFDGRVYCKSLHRLWKLGIIELPNDINLKKLHVKKKASGNETEMLNLMMLGNIGANLLHFLLLHRQHRKLQYLALVHLIDSLHNALA